MHVHLCYTRCLLLYISWFALTAFQKNIYRMLRWKKRNMQFILSQLSFVKNKYAHHTCSMWIIYTYTPWSCECFFVSYIVLEAGLMKFKGNEKWKENNDSKYWGRRHRNVRLARLILRLYFFTRYFQRKINGSEYFKSFKCGKYV